MPNTPHKMPIDGIYTPQGTQTMLNKMAELIAATYLTRTEYNAEIAALDQRLVALENYESVNHQ
jgi:hypothetical protein